MDSDAKPKLIPRNDDEDDDRQDEEDEDEEEQEQYPLKKPEKTAGKKSKKHGSTAVARASFLTAQQRIKKDLCIRNKMDADAYRTIGKCLDEVQDRIIRRWTDMRSSKQTLMSPAIALSGVMSMIPTDPEHDCANDFIADALDAFYAVSK